ncbi:MAG TPA: hypothetical protein VMD30_12780 [Tepidisphaeraceae bacterium]|nr:hypothetical protein [Tepidisphaeraceae bacterium]
MLRKLFALTLLLTLSTIAATAKADTAAAPGPYAVAAQIKIGGNGRWDYMAFDPASKLLFVTRTTHTQVIDPAAGKVVADIPDTGGAHGTALDPSLNRGFISDGKDAAVTIFDLKTFQTLGKIDAAPDVDCIVYDAASDHVLGICGDSQCIVPIPANIDPKNGKADAKVDLGGSPEYCAVDGTGNAWINIADQDEIVKVDTRAMKIVNRWSVAPGGRPTGLSMDTAHRILFIGCRNPQMLVVMNADTGKVIAAFPIGKTVDATRFDRGFALASCGDGTLTVVKESSPTQFAVVQVLKTALGARTMTVDPDTGTIYLPTAEFPPDATGNKPKPIAGTFKIVVVKLVNP